MKILSTSWVSRAGRPAFGSLFRRLSLGGFVVLAVLAGGSAAAAEPLPALCFDCHGPEGRSTEPDVPILAGQAYTVVEDNLLAFRAGERPCTVSPFRHGDRGRPETSMCAIAADLDDGDIAMLAEYFEGLDFEPVQQAYDPILAGQGAAVHESAGCEACHAGGGLETVGIACRLAGQWMPYLRSAFAQLRAGERYAPVVMADAIAGLSDEEIEALLHFYARSAGSPPP